MESHDKDQFDDLLDRTLAHYGNVEPRAGLEGRVLASVTANGGRAGVRSVLAWALASACAIVLVVAMWFGIGHRRANTPAAELRPNVSESSVQKTAMVTSPVELNKPAVRRARSRQTPATLTVAKAAEPRLQRFPSPRPVTQQEVVIAEYVEHFPEEAMLIAQEQKKFDEEIRQAQREVEDGSLISENQER